MRITAMPLIYNYYLGQVVSAEILMASENGCPIEMHQIKIDKCDEMYDNKCQGETTMPFLRARYDKSTGQSPNSPREQVKTISFRFKIYLYKIIQLNVSLINIAIKYN